MGGSVVIAGQFTLAPDDSVWLPLPSGLTRARIGRSRWVERAAERMCQAHPDGGDLMLLARRRCGELHDRAPDADVAVFFAPGEPHAMLGVFRLAAVAMEGVVATGGAVAVWEHLNEEVNSLDDDGPLTNVTRTMRSGILGDRLMFGVDFEGELEGVRVGFGGTTDQPLVAGQFATEAARLFLTLRRDPTCRRS